MGQDESYFRSLETALELVAFIRSGPDMPEYLVVSHCLRIILAAIESELDKARRAAPGSRALTDAPAQRGKWGQAREEQLRRHDA